MSTVRPPVVPVLALWGVLLGGMGGLWYVIQREPQPPQQQGDESQGETDTGQGGALVPNVVGLDDRSAKAAVEAAGFTSRRYLSGGSGGCYSPTIVVQMPAPNEYAPIGSAVAIGYVARPC